VLWLLVGVGLGLLLFDRFRRAWID